MVIDPTPLYFAAGVVTLVILVRRIYLRSLRREAEWFVGKTIVEATLVRCRAQEEYGYWCAVEYHAANGSHYQITGEFPFTPEDIGRRVKVAYEPAMPSDARL